MKLLLSLVFLGIGASLSPASITDVVSSGLLTFFGLIVAAVLASLSLLVGSVLTSASTVAHLIQLKTELDSLTHKMRMVLLAAAAGSVVVIALSIGIPQIGVSWLPAKLAPLRPVLLELSSAPARVLQGVVGVCLGLCVDNLTVISRSFKSVLDARYELALADSQKRTKLAAPSSKEVVTGFRTPDGFGDRVKQQ